MRLIRDSWIREYLRYTSGQESPQMFHLWVAFTVIATVLNRSVFFNHGFFLMYPNQYVVLVAGSQLCRKSTAIVIGRDLLERLPDRPNMLSQKLTPESLIENLLPDARRSATGILPPVSSGLLVAPEFNTLVSKSALNSGILSLLVDLYDCPDNWSYSTRMHGKEELMNVYVNLLAGASPEYLRLSLPYNEIGGGMLARTIFVYQQRPAKREPFPAFGDEQKRSRDKLVHDLVEISKARGEFVISEEGRRWYSDWYMSISPELQESMLSAYYSKKESHVLKLAMLLSIAENDSLRIEESHLRAALEILEENEKNMPFVVGTILCPDSVMNTLRVKEAIKELMELGKTPTRTLVMRKVQNYMNAQELQIAVDTLQAAGELQVTMHRSKQGGIQYVYLLAKDS